MKSLEDKIKDRLEGYESSLPEDSLAGFMDKLSAEGKSVPARRRRPLALLLVPAIAAAVLAVLLIPHHEEETAQPSIADNGSLPAELPEEPEAALEEVGVVRVAQPQMRGTISIAEEVQQTPVIEASDDVAINEANADEVEAAPDSVVDAVDTQGSPFAPVRETYPVKMKTWKAPTRILGGLGAVAIASLTPSFVRLNCTAYEEYDAGPMADEYGGSPTGGTGSYLRTCEYSHNMPLRAGASIRIPFSSRWSIVTGLDYSWYSSSIQYSSNVYRQQNVHYLGIPLRADFMIIDGNVVNVYAGAGGEADFCIAANLNGNKIQRDGVCFSLQGVAGVQFNLTRGVGIYLEPALSWDVPSDGRTLETYRTVHPLSFTISSGIRLTLP